MTLLSAFLGPPDLLIWATLLAGLCPLSESGIGPAAGERKIVLLPIGKIEGWVLDVLERELSRKFDCCVERREALDVPEDALNAARNQYHSSRILGRIHGCLELEGGARGLGICDVDLYTGGLNFVFGEAELGGKWAIISLTRLRQSFYSLPEGQDIFRKRTIKEAVHELGHVHGLEHCPNPECVMHFSNSLLDTDRKSASFCPRCRARLQKLIQ